MTPSHERPLLVVLGPKDRPGEALRALLSHPTVKQHWMPPLWCLERAGIDLPGELQDVTSITLGSLPRVVETLLRLATKDALDRHVARVWRQADEQVRSYYLHRGLGSAIATMLRVSPKSSEIAPPERFREDRIHESGFEVQYRIASPGGERNVLAPAEEATVVFYPFDPAGAAARHEAGLSEGPEPVLEVFAYDDGRRRHREALEEVAALHSWRVLDAQA